MVARLARYGRYNVSISFHRPLTRLTAVGAALALILGAAACGSSGSAEASGPTSDSATESSTQQQTSEASTPQQTPSEQAPAPETTAAESAAVEAAPLTIYTGQHEELVEALAAAFTDATGIDITIRAGDDAELANQIIEEGDGSPADLFLSEEPGPVALLDTKGLTSTINADALAEVDQRLVPSSQGWLPYATRSRVIYYNPTLIDEADLPTSVMDLTDAKWQGQFAYAPSGAFAATVSYLIDAIGSDETLTWLEGIKANGINEQRNGKVRDSVEAGQHAFGLSNHYYWYQLAADKGGPDQLTSKVHFFDHADAGGLLLASGAAVIKSSQHQDEAQQFVTWLGSADGGQQVLASDPAAQIPVAAGVTSDLGLPALSDLVFPEVDSSVYSDTTAAKDLIIESGIA